MISELTKPKPTKNRDDFSRQTVETLAKRAQYLCSFDDCNLVTVGPTESDKRVANLGVAAHITAAAPGGPRYDPTLTPEQRAHESNGIWLCQVHGKHVDDDPVRFTGEWLRATKASAERRATQRIARAASHSSKPLLVLRHDTLKPSVDVPTLEDLPALMQGREIQRVEATFVDHLKEFGTSQEALDGVAGAMVSADGALRACLGDPQTDILYFGFPHVPFGVLAGRLAESNRHVRLVEHDHITGRFRWGPTADFETASPVVEQRPTGRVARLLVSVSARVDPTLCSQVVPKNQSRVDIQVGLQKPCRGGITSEAQARHFVDDVAREVDAAIGGKSGIEALHVFAAVPVSVAFLLGQRVFAGTGLPPVIVHSLTSAPQPAYRWALNLFDAMAGRRGISMHGV